MTDRQKLEADLNRKLKELGFGLVKIDERIEDELIYIGVDDRPIMDAPIARVQDGKVVLDDPYLPTI